MSRVADGSRHDRAEGHGTLIGYLPVGFPDLQTEHRCRRRPGGERRGHRRARPAVLGSGDGWHGHPAGDPGVAGRRVQAASRFRGGRGDLGPGRRAAAAHDLLEPGAAVRRRPLRRRPASPPAAPGSSRPTSCPTRRTRGSPPPTAPAWTACSWRRHRRPTSGCAARSRQAAASSTPSRRWASPVPAREMDEAARTLVGRLRDPDVHAHLRRSRHLDAGAGRGRARATPTVRSSARRSCTRCAEGGVDAVGEKAAELATGTARPTG